MLKHSLIALSLAMAAAAPVPAAAPGPFAVAPAYGDKARDRTAILAMAGTYKVTFDMRETVPFLADYSLLKPKLSGGHEVVRVIADTPDLISLQHLLVVEIEGRKPLIVKHWRQDWAWQPKAVLSYVGPGQWALLPIAAAEARGGWSQTVYQTDDSPRYGAIGRWRYDGGVARWTSAETSRPLARRDATRHPPYDHYIGTNRHAITPSGWVHEQDNAKIGGSEGGARTYAHEILLNSYERADNFPVAAADDYWAKTRDYWAFVRDRWQRHVASHGGVRLAEEADNGSATGHRLMELADEVANGAVKLDQAKQDAAGLIARTAG